MARKIVLVLLWWEMSMHGSSILTVFVHGTCPAPFVTSCALFEEFFEAPAGLSKAQDLPNHFRFHQTAQAAIAKAPELFSSDLFYIYRWPAHIVSHKHRLAQAQLLHHQLQELLDQLFAQGVTILCIRFIGFSHGGNLILNLGAYTPLLCQGVSVAYETWLLGTPVMQCNKEYAQSPVFSRMYMVYSAHDLIQRLDPQDFQPSVWFSYQLFSDRYFKTGSFCVHIALEFEDGFKCGHITFGVLLKDYLADIMLLALQEHEKHKKQHFSITVPLTKSHCRQLYAQVWQKMRG